MSLGIGPHDYDCQCARCQSRRFEKIDFTCRVCGAGCDIAPDPPARAVCPNCCDDHEYEYVRGERGHFCKHCGEGRPPDWFDEP